jgi:chromosome segregation ATPase
MFTDKQIETIEQGCMGLVALIVLICSLANPQSCLSLTREQLTSVCVRDGRRVVQLQSSLQAAQDCAKAQKAEAATASDFAAKLQEQIRSIQKERDTFRDQMGQSAAKAKDLESQLQTARAEIAKLNDRATSLIKQRDEAIARADKDEDRIRQLTLQLHRAGIWP